MGRNGEAARNDVCSVSGLSITVINFMQMTRQQARNTVYVCGEPNSIPVGGWGTSPAAGPGGALCIYNDAEKTTTGRPRPTREITEVRKSNSRRIIVLWSLSEAGKL